MRQGLDDDEHPLPFPCAPFVARTILLFKCTLTDMDQSCHEGASIVSVGKLVRYVPAENICLRPSVARGNLSRRGTCLSTTYTDPELTPCNRRDLGIHLTARRSEIVRYRCRYEGPGCNVRDSCRTNLCGNL